MVVVLGVVVGAAGTWRHLAAADTNEGGAPKILFLSIPRPARSRGRYGAGAPEAAAAVCMLIILLLLRVVVY